MPLCSAASSATQFEFSWRAWQVEVSPNCSRESFQVVHYFSSLQVSSRLQEGDFAAFPELTTVAQLLAGQEEALHLAAERCETWLVDQF